jgi:hypothetical protein
MVVVAKKLKSHRPWRSSILEHLLSLATLDIEVLVLPQDFWIHGSNIRLMDAIGFFVFRRFEVTVVGGHEWP